jgi:hypothetical protein
MQTKINLELGPGSIPHRGLHCTRKQARELLEGLCTAYQSLWPDERIVIRNIVDQLARPHLTQEMNIRNRRPPELDRLSAGPPLGGKKFKSSCHD